MTLPFIADAQIDSPYGGKDPFIALPPFNKLHDSGNKEYRVKIIDQRDSISQLNPVSVFFDTRRNNIAFTVYPAVTKSDVNTSATNAVKQTPSYSMDIYNAAGILVSRKTAAENTMSQNVSQYQPGVYIIEVKNGNGLALGKAKFLKLK